jgi:hypothetical protein
MKAQIEKEIFMSKNTRKTLIKPVPERRIAQELEEKRLSEETA